jgi:hypothetical protein
MNVTTNDLFIIIGELTVELRQMRQALNDLTNEYNMILSGEKKIIPKTPESDKEP